MQDRCSSRRLVQVGSSIAAGALLAIAGCDSTDANSASEHADTPDQVTHQGEPDAVYEVRGEIDRLPSSTGDLMIHHESIPTFTDKNSVVVGMNSMTMPFPELGPGVTLDGLAPGDKIAFTMAVWWSPPQGWAITAIDKLPADTELDFTTPGVPTPEHPSEPIAPDDTLTVRGTIKTLPAADSDDRRLTVRHEAIDRFANAADEVVGMRSMTMPFVADEGVSLAGLAPGSIVEMTVKTEWDDGRLTMLITAITPLPPGTTLDYDRLPSPGG